jgi:pre-mRNA-processing factor 6
MKSALLEREVGDIDAELALLDEAIALYPSFAKYYMMAGQACHEVLADTTRARSYYQDGIKACTDCITLWILLASLEEETKGTVKARSVMEMARLKFPKNPELWLHSVRFERKIPGNERLADSLMARALQECPDSGILWAEELLACSKQQQKSKSIEADKRCNNDPHVVIAIARLFETDRKYPKARKWFERAVTLAPRLGDAWIYLYAFELRQAKMAKLSEKTCEPILAQCTAAQPNSGELWCAVAKKTENRRKDVGTILKLGAAGVLLKGGAAATEHNKDSSMDE